jgi:hypothetical protein
MLRILGLVVVVGCQTPEAEEGVFEGPGFDPSTGLIEPVDGPLLVALTELHVRNAPGPGRRFGEHAQAIGEHLYGSQPPIPGFIGGSFRNVGQLQNWTMTVWRDEASMLAFVVSEPHVLAMGDTAEVSVRARSTHLEISPDELPYEWDVALPILEAEDWTFGEAP